MTTFDFRFEPLYRAAATAFGVTPRTSGVTLTDDELAVRFGLWRMGVPTAAIVDTEVTGPYQLIKTIGPPHLSLADRGISFVTNRERGLCLQLSTPVPGIEPLRRIRHPGVTLTVEDPVALQRAVEQVIARRREAEGAKTTAKASR